MNKLILSHVWSILVVWVGFGNEVDCLPICMLVIHSVWKVLKRLVLLSIIIYYLTTFTNSTLCLYQLHLQCIDSGLSGKPQGFHLKAPGNHRPQAAGPISLDHNPPIVVSYTFIQLETYIHQNVLSLFPSSTFPWFAQQNTVVLKMSVCETSHWPELLHFQKTFYFLSTILFTLLLYNFLSSVSVSKNTI